MALAIANHLPQRQSANNRLLFQRIFSREAVIRELCKQRAKLADRRNETQFLHRINKYAGRQGGPRSSEIKIQQMFPPRRRWHRYRARQRGSLSAFDLNVAAIFRAVMNQIDTTPQEAWAKRLDECVSKIRERVFSNSPFTFVKPRIIPLEKEKGKHIFRPLAAFPLEDKIIDCLTARYLRLILDKALRPSCLAFRCRQGNKTAPTIHDALKKLVNVNRRHRKRGLFVAECDIKSFFDCVSHEVARKSLRELISDAKLRKPGQELEPRSLEIFDAYLNIYSFFDNVKSRESSLLSPIDPLGKFKWPADDLKRFHGTASPSGVGVPQGGALSCLIANAVLHGADKNLDRLRRQKRKSFTYMRYCDDMIILASDYRIAKRAYSEYAKALTKKSLPIHHPESIREYGPTFWEAKSKSTYRWGPPSKKFAVPWIQFVGYQVRYDGFVRVRRTSISKQLRKMTRAADELLNVLNPGYRRGRPIPQFAHGLRKSNNQIIHRFRQRLISIGVGRVRLGQKHEAPMPMCWSNGFRGLVGQKIVTSMLKAFDRHHERQIRRISKRLKLRQNVPSKDRNGVNVNKFYGTPFSYWGQFAP